MLNLWESRELRAAADKKFCSLSFHTHWDHIFKIILSNNISSMLFVVSLSKLQVDFLYRDNHVTYNACMPVMIGSLIPLNDCFETYREGGSWSWHWRHEVICAGALWRLTITRIVRVIRLTVTDIQLHRHRFDYTVQESTQIAVYVILQGILFIKIPRWGGYSGCSFANTHYDEVSILFCQSVY